MRWYIMCESYEIECHSLPSLVWTCLEHGDLRELYTYFCTRELFTTKAPHSAKLQNEGDMMCWQNKKKGRRDCVLQDMVKQTQDQFEL